MRVIMRITMSGAGLSVALSSFALGLGCPASGPSQGLDAGGGAPGCAAPCVAGLECVGGRCVPTACGTAAQCPATFECLHGFCTDLSCTPPCGPSEVCAQAICYQVSGTSSGAAGTTGAGGASGGSSSGGGGSSGSSSNGSSSGGATAGGVGSTGGSSGGAPATSGDGGATAGCGYPAAVLADAPVAYYRLDESSGSRAADASGHGQSGSYGSGVTLGVSGLLTGDPDLAAGFPGGAWTSADLVTVPPSSLLEPTGAVTIELWLRQPAVNHATFPGLASYGAQSSGQPWALQLDPTQGLFDFYLKTSSGSFDLQSQTVAAANRPVYVVATYDGAAASIYVDGVLDASKPVTGTLTGYDALNGLAIGGSLGTTRPTFTGTLDEVAIYATALSKAQIQAHFAAGSCGTGTTSGGSSGGGLDGGAGAGGLDAGPPPPARVHTMAYYETGYANDGVPASFMAKHVDFAESDHAGGNLQAFRADGGRFALLYDDSTYVPYCDYGDGGTGTCAGPYGATQPESAWFHDTQGNRMHRYVSSHYLYQEALDPGSPAVLSAVASATQALVTGSSGVVNAFLCDDTGAGPWISACNYGNYCATPFVGFADQSLYPQADYTDQSFAQAEVKRVNAYAAPCFYNGEGAAYVPALSRVLLAASNVLGAASEGCFGQGGGTAYGALNGLVTDEGSRWLLTSNALLNVTNAGRYAACLVYPATAGGVQTRLYALASWYLGFDPALSVLFSAVPTSDLSPTGAELTIGDEISLVPLNPRQTATASSDTSPAGDVRTLDVGQSLYRREFADCDYRGRRIGSCAAIVNANKTTSQGLPTLSGSYSSSLVLSSTSLYGGGTIAWTGSVPSSLPPATAVVLLGP
ncbi:MAG: LamG domain-containing protein [Deltaproteobacteria bacterium]